ncbi:MAG: LamG domain-containing protein [Micavibrio sp.]|nr:LamG domain-containing protein [Micavibrio sp.]
MPIRFLALLCTIVFSVPQLAWADCSSPAAVAGAREYTNGGYKICDGTTWLYFHCPDSTWTATLRRYWKLDNTGGDPTESAIGATTTQSNVTWAPTTGYRDGNASFNGTTSYINAGGNTTTDIDNLMGSAGLSVSAWIYPMGLGENTNGTIIGKDNGTAAAPTNGWYLRLVSSDRIEFLSDHATTDLVVRSANNAITLNAWNHIVLTWTGSTTATTAKIYVNGTEVSYGTQTNGSGARATDAARDMIIGNNRVATLGRTFAGQIDEVYVFDGIVSATEIATLKSRGCTRLNSCATTASTVGYNTTTHAFEYCDGTNLINLGCPAVTSATPPATTNLIGHWKLDESAGTAADSSGNGHTGTVINSGRFSWQPTGGQVNGAAAFAAVDGAGDSTQAHIDLGTSLNVTALPVSFAAWVNLTDINDYRGIIGKRTACCGNTKFFWLVLNSGTVSFETATSTVNFTYTLPLGQWKHLVVVATASDTKLYVNGVLTETLGVLGFGSGPAGAHVNIGDNGEIDSGGGIGDGDPWKGSIDDVRIYTEELDAGEVAGLYGSSICASLGSCSNEGEVEYDSTGNFLKWCNGTDWIGFTN